LYAEELDYFKRAKSAGFEKLIIGDAIVYHKEGGTTN
jgi:GT2 family glycosyltransferase